MSDTELAMLVCSQVWTAAALLSFDNNVRWFASMILAGGFFGLFLAA